MHKYEVLSQAGSGNFSNVYKAKDLLTGELVAIKEMKRSEDVQQLAIKELKILSTLKHPNIIELKEVVEYEGDVKIVFEFVEENLLELYESSKVGVNQNQIKCILYQTAFALEYLHSEKKIVHRDIKPENILIDRKKAMVKLIDFGLAKQEHLASTNYVATRWYRSPENLIGLKKYTTAIDIFSLACVIVELINLAPLFPGEEMMDQLYRVFGLLGTPTEESWAVGWHELRVKGISVPFRPKLSLKTVLPSASDGLVDLLEEMLVLNPERRIKARDVMRHPFFEKVERVIPGAVHKEAIRYLEEINERKKKIPMAKSLSPNTAASNRYSPMRELMNGEMVGKEGLGMGSKVSNGKASFGSQSIYNIGNHLQIPTLPMQTQIHNSSIGTNINHGISQTKYSFGYCPTPTTPTQHPPHPRPLHFPSPPPTYKSPLPTKRQDHQYLGIDPVQLQNIKKKIQMHEGVWSPKYNVRYFKEPKEDKARRNLSVDAQRNRAVVCKSVEQGPLVMPFRGKNMMPARVNFRSG